LTPLLTSRLGIHDTCGVHNLHGMPAVIAGLGSAIGAALATKEVYGESLASVFEQEPGQEWAPGAQAGNQLAALGVTLAIAIVGGAATGFIMKIPIWGQQEDLYEDAEAWILEEGEEEEGEDDVKDEQKREPLSIQIQS